MPRRTTCPHLSGYTGCWLEVPSTTDTWRFRISMDAEYGSNLVGVDPDLYRPSPLRAGQQLLLWVGPRLRAEFRYEPRLTGRVRFSPRSAGRAETPTANPWQDLPANMVRPCNFEGAFVRKPRWFVEELEVGSNMFVELPPVVTYLG